MYSCYLQRNSLLPFWMLSTRVNDSTTQRFSLPNTHFALHLPAFNFCTLLTLSLLCLLVPAPAQNALCYCCRLLCSSYISNDLAFHHSQWRDLGNDTRRTQLLFDIFDEKILYGGRTLQWARAANAANEPWHHRSWRQRGCSSNTSASELHIQKLS